MEVHIIKRGSASGAPIKTYSRRRTLQPPRKKRRLSNVSIAATKPLELLHRSQDSAGRINKSAEQSEALSEQLQNNGVQHSSKKRRIEDISTSTTRSERSIELQQITAQREDKSDPVQLSTLITEHKQSPLHTIAPQNTPQNPQQRPKTPTISPPQVEDSVKLLRTIKTTKASIRHYFKAVPASTTFVPNTSSSSPSSKQSTCSDTSEPRSTPPSSPPTSIESPEDFRWKSQRRVRRRLTTKPLLAPVKMEPFNRKPTPDGPTSTGKDGADVDEKVGLPVDNEKVESSEDPERSPLPISPSSSKGTDNTTPHDSPLMSIPPVRRISTGESLVQMKLTHTSTMEQCGICGMSYDRSFSNDRKAHEEFCKTFTGGSPPKDDSDVCISKTIHENQEHSIVVIDRRSPHKWRAHAEWALRSSFDGLGGVDLAMTTLWTKFDHRKLHEVPRYKVYIYTIDSRFTAVILAECIDYAGRYGKEADFKEWVCITPQFPVYVCIDRIWVDSSHRMKGIATTLVDTVRETFARGKELGKKHIAFSLPTEAGSFFATAYCRGTDYGYDSDSAINFLVNPLDVPYHKQMDLKTNTLVIVENRRLLRDSRYI